MSSTNIPEQKSKCVVKGCGRIFYAFWEENFCPVCRKVLTPENIQKWFEEFYTDQGDRQLLIKKLQKIWDAQLIEELQEQEAARI